MAGGEGTRLRPLTSNQPKPMMPVANRPMMEHVVDLLKRHGFQDIVVTVAFQANAIRTYFGDGSEFGVRMVYATEENPLGTAGSVRNAMDELTETFLVISGDVVTDIDLRSIVEFHSDKKALATIGSSPANREYFFANLHSPDWLEPLRAAGRFRSPIHAVPDERGIAFLPWQSLHTSLGWLRKSPSFCATSFWSPRSLELRELQQNRQLR